MGYSCISEVKFKCDNGNNLYNVDEICNRVNDCGPNDDSDETRDCGKQSFVLSSNFTLVSEFNLLYSDGFFHTYLIHYV